MINLFIANSIVLLHGIFILFAIFGGYLAWRWWRIIFLHIPAVCWGVWIELSHGICPLTPLENTYRHLAGEAGYQQGFIEHYLLPIIYPTNLTADLQTIFAATLLLINSIAYGVLIKRYQHRTSPTAID